MHVPEKIGRYEIEKELGRGGMALVFLARDPLMERLVALKLLPPQFAPNESLRARFRREARIIASLEHPAIVPVYDFGEYNEQPYLVMRYMTGGSLKDRLATGSMALPEALGVLYPLTQALDKAHDQHIIHRDLKPDNILFDADENPYLSDFGIARLAEGTQTTSIMGTPAYMSPEQITGEVELDSRSDIYALGVILFEMLSGHPPFEAETPTQIMMKHVLEPVPNILERVATLPPATQTVIEQAMAKNREERYASAEELVDALKSLLTGAEAAALMAALPGTRLQETMLEFPGESILSGATVVERPPTAIPPRPPRATQGTPQAQAAGAATGDKSNAAPAIPAPKRNRAWLWGAGLLAAVFMCAVLAWAATRVIGSFRDVGTPGTPVAAERGIVASSGVGVATDSTATATATPEPSPEPTLTAAVTATAVAPTATSPPPTAQPTASPIPVEILFEDFDSDGAAANWDLREDESSAFWIADGQLFAAGYDPELFSWTSNQQKLTEFEATVSATIREGARDGFFGVVFQSANDDYLACLIQGDNTGYCAQRVDGTSESGNWVEVDLSVLRANELLLVVSQGRWAVVVNDQCVGSGSSAFVPEGTLGLLSSTASAEQESVVAYDNLLVRTPAETSLSYLGCTPVAYESS